MKIFKSIILLFSFFLTSAFYSNTFTVTNTNDIGLGSFRQAIIDANALVGLDEIVFNISGVGPFTIQPQSTLPQINDAVTIDGSSQNGSICGGDLMIVLDFSMVGGIGLDFTNDADGSSLNGLVINGANDGVEINDCDNFTISCCYIGTNFNGSLAVPNTRYGIYAIGEVNDFKLGGTLISEGNVVSGNIDQGVRFNNKAHSNIQIENNKIGVDLSGINPIGNGNTGVTIDGDASNNLIIRNNVFSSNTTYGVYAIDFDTILFEGNRVGTDINGSNNLGNENIGFYVRRSQNITVDDNVISNNGGTAGVYFYSTSDISFTNNFIGTDATGTVDLGNVSRGFYSTTNASELVTINNSEFINNIVSGNGSNGIELRGFNNALFQGNIIGADASGTVPMANSSGIALYDYYTTTAQIVSSNVLLENNLISGNSSSGIYADGTDSVQIINNTIGPDVTGNNFLIGGDNNGFPSGQNGINVNGDGLDRQPHQILIKGNLISGNTKVNSAGSLTTSYGVYIEAADSIRIQGNKIGTKVLGDSALRNGYGIYIAGYGNTSGVLYKAKNILIGGSNALDQNIISGNTITGVYLLGADSAIVENNIVGTDITGAYALFGTTVGDSITSLSGQNGIYATSSTLGRTSSEIIIKNNLISGNEKRSATTGNVSTTYGIYIVADDVEVSNNKIGTDISGLEAIPNYRGVYIASTSADTLVSVIDKRSSRNIAIGGVNLTDGNLISGNYNVGVYATGYLTKGVLIENNSIGLDVNGNDLGNGSDGVFIHGGADSIVVTKNSIAFNKFNLNNNVVNTRSGIDISGITANDLFDVDDIYDGANQGLNHPIIKSVILNGASLDINFGVDLISGDYRVEVFNTPQAYSPQAHTYIGSYNISHSGGGYTNFTQAFSPSILPVLGDVLTLTITQLSSLGEMVRTSQLSIEGVVSNPLSGIEICNNGIDDDGDGFSDCFDSDCPCYAPSFCDNSLYQGFGAQEATTISDSLDWTISIVDPNTGAFTDVVNATEAAGVGIGLGFNGLSFNPQDGFIYAYNGVDFRIYRFNSIGEGESVSTIYGVENRFGSASGCMDLFGTMYVTNSVFPYDVYKVNPLTGEATSIVASGPGVTADIAFNPKDGLLYGMYRDTTDSELMQPWSLDPVNGIWTELNAGGSNKWYSSPSAYFDGQGNFYIYLNTAYDFADSSALDSGAVYKYDYVNDEFELLTYGPIAAGTDGCSCPFSLELTKESLSDTVYNNDTLTYHFQVINNSALTIDSVFFVDTLLGGLNFISKPYNITGIVFDDDSSYLNQSIINLLMDTIILGENTFDIDVLIPCNYSGNEVYKNRGHVIGLSAIATFYLDTINSDDPNTAAILDSTNTIVIHDNLIAEADSNYLINCYNPLVTLDGSASSQGVDYVYSWSSDLFGSILSGENTINPIVDSTGKYFITVTNTSTNCVQIDSTLVTIDTNANVSIITDYDSLAPFYIFENQTFSYQGDLGSNNWFVNGEDVSQNPIFTINFQESGEQLISIDLINQANGCIAKDSVVVKVIHRLLIPSAVSANTDGFNDLFLIKALENYDETSLVIFNRWGNSVFEASPYLNDWEGQSNTNTLTGEKVVDGTYFYILKLIKDEEEFIFKGSIELRRN